MICRWLECLEALKSTRRCCTFIDSDMHRQGWTMVGWTPQTRILESKGRGGERSILGKKGREVHPISILWTPTNIDGLAPLFKLSHFFFFFPLSWMLWARVFYEQDVRGHIHVEDCMKNSKDFWRSRTSKEKGSVKDTEQNDKQPFVIKKAASPTKICTMNTQHSPFFHSAVNGILLLPNLQIIALGNSPSRAWKHMKCCNLRW